jgi:osmotically-inducible protein OsmY
MATSSTITKKSDDAIRKDVASELEWDPVLAEQDIGVAVKDGVVTLAGSVPSLWMKTEAEKAAKRVYGVRGVANDIRST